MIFDEGVRWEMLKPAEFLSRQAEKPVVYLPMGLCEPHGHIAPFGLDTIKADWLCDQAARRFGGIVAPTMAYHTHETGYHKPWLREVMGGVNPRLAALPPHLVLETLLYQFRAFYNAGFQAAVVISGHHGSQEDLRRVSSAFEAAYDFSTFVRTDPELVSGKFDGDHAGRYELSQLLAIRPDLVEMSRADRVDHDPLGRFAQNPDVEKASVSYGTEILEAQLTEIGLFVEKQHFCTDREIPMGDVATIWEGIDAQKRDWRTLNQE
ncbi:creatininase family protein [Rhizobium sp. LjRoot98]|uniref:creatininase family protein n=1 Tax=Rhizobium sp. LjRoot98 TaxID=3342345 RepID=UPI003ECD37DA